MGSYGIVTNWKNRTGFGSNSWKLIVEASRVPILFTFVSFLLGSIVGVGNSWPLSCFLVVKLSFFFSFFFFFVIRNSKKLISFFSRFDFWFSIREKRKEIKSHFGEVRCNKSERNGAKVSSGAFSDENVSACGWPHHRRCDIVEWRWFHFCGLEDCRFCQGLAA